MITKEASLRFKLDFEKEKSESLLEEVKELKEQLDCATDFCRQYQIENKQMKERVKELESELADAKKDQARYQCMHKAIVNCDKRVEEILLDNLTDTNSFCEFDAAVDLAIKENQQ